MRNLQIQSVFATCSLFALGAAALATSCGGEGGEPADSSPPAFSGEVPGGPANNLQGSDGSQVPTDSSASNGANTSQTGQEGTSVNESPGGTNTGLDQNQNSARQEQGGTGGAGGGSMMGSAGSQMAATGGSEMVAAGGSEMVAAGGAGMEDPNDEGNQDQTPAGDGSCPADALFCEDFEGFATGAPNNAPWNTQGNLSIDGNQVANGARALRIQTQGNGNGYLTVNGFSPPGNSFFGRINVRVEDFPLAPDYAHFTMVELTGQGGGLVRPMGGQYIPGQGPGGTALWGMGNDQGSSGDWTNWQPTAPTQSGQWICYEWEMDASDNIMNAWLDGVAQPGMSVSTNNHTGNGQFQFPQFNQISIGWWLYQGNNGSYDIWMDDIVLAPSRVGCGAN